MESLQEWLTQPEGVATRLRALRAQAGLSGRALAERYGWQQSKVSRLEHGKHMPSHEDVEAWAAACGADEATLTELLRLLDEARTAHATFRQRMRRGQTAVQNSYNDLVRNSRVIAHFETCYIPGLIQVPAYARRVLSEMVSLHELPIDDVDAAVAARMQRQQMLYTSEREFSFLLAESVLRWRLCPPDVMRSQLDRLQTLIGLPQIRFGVLPFDRTLTTAPQNAFQCYIGEEIVVAVETFTGESFYRGEQAARFERVLERLWDEAVEGEDARRLIMAATQKLTSRDS